MGGNIASRLICRWLHGCYFDNPRPEAREHETSKKMLYGTCLEPVNATNKIIKIALTTK